MPFMDLLNKLGALNQQEDLVSLPEEQLQSPMTDEQKEQIKAMDVAPSTPEISPEVEKLNKQTAEGKQLLNQQNGLDKLLEEKIRSGLEGEKKDEEALASAKNKEKWMNFATQLAKAGAQIGSGLAGTPGLGTPKADLTQFQSPEIVKDVMAEQKLKADKLKDLLAEYQKTKTGESAKAQQSDYITLQGNPTYFDPNRKIYLDAITGAPVDKVIRKTSDKSIAGYGIAAPIENPEQEIEAAKNFRPSVNHVKSLKEGKKSYDSATKTYKSAILSANQVLDAINTNNKLTPSVVRTKMPRMFGEVGNLSETEQKVWQGSSYAPDRLSRWFDSFADPDKTLTDHDVSQLKEIIKTSVGQVNAAADMEKNNIVENLKVEGIPGMFSNKYLGERLKSNVTGDGSIKMQFPDGKVKMVPKNRVDEFKKLGGTEL